MSAKSGRAPEMPWLSPYLTVKSAEAALDFYQRAFGFVQRNAMPGPDGRVMHAEMTWNDAVVMFGPECPTQTYKAPITTGVPPPLGLYLYCDDVDAQCERARTAGATVVSPPETKFYGDRVCTLSDPDGYTWYFATHLGNGHAKPAQ